MACNVYPVSPWAATVRVMNYTSYRCVSCHDHAMLHVSTGCLQTQGEGMKGQRQGNVGCGVVVLHSPPV